jgi:hypothetical protein
VADRVISSSLPLNIYNKLSLDEIEALRFAEEGSVEKKVFWELQ